MLSDVEVRITDLLASWGRSKAMDDTYHLDLPHVSPYAREMRTPGTWSSKVAEIPDELHAQIDQAVSELGARKDRRGKAVTLAYLHGLRDVDIAKYLHCSRSSAREARIAGENWLEARIT